MREKRFGETTPKPRQTLGAADLIMGYDNARNCEVARDVLETPLE